MLKTVRIRQQINIVETPLVRPIHALALPHVPLVEMLVHEIALLIVKFLRVGSGKLIENVLHGREDHRSRGLLLSPVQYQLLPLLCIRGSVWRCISLDLGFPF
jgi:hypothetical protein